METKTCKGKGSCGESLPLDMFPAVDMKTHVAYNNRCRDCQQQYDQERQKNYVRENVQSYDYKSCFILTKDWRIVPPEALALKAGEKFKREYLPR